MPNGEVKYNISPRFIQSAAQPTIRVVNTRNNASNQVARFEGRNTTRADLDEIYLSFYLADDQGTPSEVARINGYIFDVTAGEKDGGFSVEVMRVGQLREALDIHFGGSNTPGFTTFNGGNQRMHFQVKTSGQAYAFYIEDNPTSGQGYTLFGRNTQVVPDSQVHIWAASAGTVAAPSGTLLTLENSSQAYLSLLTPNNAVSGICFGDPEDNDVGKLTYDHATDTLTLDATAAASGKVQLNADQLGFFGATPAARPAAYTPSNVTPDRSYDANATSVEELADVLGTLIADLQGYGLLQ